MSLQKVATRGKTGKKKAARKGNGRAEPGNGAGQQPDLAASTRWFQMLDSLDLPDLYTLLGSIEKRIGNREAAGEDLVAKPPTRDTRTLKISDTLTTLSHQLDVAADAARANDWTSLETTLYQLSEGVKAQADALTEILRGEPAESESAS